MPRFLQTHGLPLLLVCTWYTTGFSQNPQTPPTAAQPAKLPPAILPLAEKLAYQNPGLKVDLGVGLWAWPIPMDYDQDGDHDLVVMCPDVPSAGAWYFENADGKVKRPTFKPGRKVGVMQRNVQVSYVDGLPRLLTPGFELIDFQAQEFKKLVKIHPQSNIHPNKVRANQWKYVDYDGDGALDLVVGVGDWTDYGWDDAFDAQGRWTRGPLHGYVYWLRNQGSTADPKYDDPVKVHAAGIPVDVYGMPSPNFADFDGDGDLDLLCGEFLDGFTYFENQGSRPKPVYAAGRRLSHDGQPLKMNLEMIVPVAFDWDHDGDLDLIVGDEDGRVALVEHTGKIVDGTPVFLPPFYFQQQAEYLKFGALATPTACDLDGDGDQDLVVGNSAGHIAFFENLDGRNPPRWSAPRLLETESGPIRLQAGANGSIQGPCEAKWGYATLTVGDWDHDGRLDLVLNSIWGKVEWLRNLGGKPGDPQSPLRFSAPRPIGMEWAEQPPKPAWNWWSPKADELAVQWRTTPVVVDWNRDGLNDLVSLDHEGYLSFFERARRDDRLILLPGRRMFTSSGPSVFNARHVPRTLEPGILRLNDGTAGASGRRKLCLVDWDGDGDLDLLVNTLNAGWLEQTGVSERATTFTPRDNLCSNLLAGHTTSPTAVDWNRDGVPDLLIGAEDGFFYYLRRAKPSKP